MILIYDKIGQMSNRIWSAVPSIAYSLENKNKMYFLYFGDYLKIFPTINQNPLIRFCKLNGRRTIIFKILSKLNKLGCIPTHFKDLNTNSNLKLIQGWRSRHMVDSALITKHKDEICKIFLFDDSIINQVNKSFDANRKTDNLIVGVHIRRGDYKEWINGKYYFSDDIYLKWMQSIEKELKSRGKSTTFFIASNDKVQLANFEGLNCFNITNSSSEQDMYALSRCHYIIGPPSTYSQWAAFINDIPLRFLLSENDNIYIEEFSKVISLFYFENNKSMILEEDGFKYVNGLTYNYNRI